MIKQQNQAKQNKQKKKINDYIMSLIDTFGF